MAPPYRPLVALLLLMVIAGPVQAADSEFRGSKSQLPRKVHAIDPEGEQRMQDFSCLRKTSTICSQPR
jgi:hypothetical protein